VPAASHSPLRAGAPAAVTAAAIAATSSAGNIRPTAPMIELQA
jgi:hypothetical protein